MPEWGLAAIGGVAAGGALVLGAAIAWFVRVPDRVTATIMAFGAGGLISALAFDLVLEAEETSGLLLTSAAFLAGAVVYVAANLTLHRIRRQPGQPHAQQPERRRPHLPRQHRAHGAVKRVGQLHRLGQRAKPGTAADSTGSGIAIGALLDGVPESAIIGLTAASSGALSIPLLVAVGISNVPEGLSSTAAMKASGRSRASVFRLWGTIGAVCAVSSLAGYFGLGALDEHARSVTQAVAAGAILAMICDTMIPDAFRRTGAFTGLAATVGFLGSFMLHVAV